MEIVKYLWSLIINLDLIVIAILVLGTIRLCIGKTCKTQKPTMTICGLLLIFMLGDWPFSGRDILRRLEDYYPTIESPKDVQGIIITGGSLCLFETDVKGTAVYHKTAGRLFEALKVMNAHPDTTVIFAGSKMEGQEFLKLTEGLGIKQDNIKVVDNEKVHSLEAAAEKAAELANDKKSEKWLLITSAFSMPRTMQVFASDGWNVTAFPVDFHTIGHSFDKKSTGFFTRLSASFQDRLGLVAWNIAWREIAGLCNLYVSGKTKTLLPKNNAT